jgi:hypothetical protein
MTLEKVKVLHGLVIRVSGDTGEQIGAHVEWVERIVDTETGTVEAAKMLPPEPLEPGADALSPLIGEIVRVQQAALDAAIARMDTAERALGAEQEAHSQTTEIAEQNARSAAEQVAALLSRLEGLATQGAASVGPPSPAV